MKCDVNTLCLEIVPIFKNLTHEEQKDIAKIAVTKNIKKDTYLFNQGDKLENLFIIHKGSVKISRYNVNGDEQILRILKPGDFISELSFLTNKQSDNFAYVLEESEICTLNGSIFKEHLNNKPDILIKILNEMSKRVLDLENKVEQINLYSALNRIIIDLLNYNLTNITLKISKREWANSLGMSLETLSRNLTKLKNDHFIELNGQRNIVILNKERLEELLNE